VWFDALVNYLTGVGFGEDDVRFDHWWTRGTVVHLVGKDILKFHGALWPAMLLSAGLRLPDRLFVHGFFTVNSDKISKSRGNAIDPLALSEAYGLDTLRYFLLREMAFGEDGDFREERLKERYEKELANELGNLVQRTLSMALQYVGHVPETGVTQAVGGTPEEVRAAWEAYHSALSTFAFHDALQAIWRLIQRSNQAVESHAPWRLSREGKKEELHRVLYGLLETLRHLAWMLAPFLPEASDKIFQALSLPSPKPQHGTLLQEAQPWGGLKGSHPLKKIAPIFPKTHPHFSAREPRAEPL
jgi:methionyl-tRNA synthetase